MVDQVYGAGMSSPTTRPGFIAAVALLVALAAGSVAYFAVGRDDSAACGAPFAEAIDPGSSQHLLPGAPEPHYSTNPPTSGPHKPGTYPTGALSDSIEPAVQVNMLEAGDVLIQYRDLSSDGVRKLRKLAGDHVTVAPNPSLGTNIVATAWLYKMECARVDIDDLETFVDAHLEKVHAH